MLIKYAKVKMLYQIKCCYLTRMLISQMFTVTALGKCDVSL